MFLACIHLVVAFFLSTKKIVAVSTISRKDHGIAQTREVACTKVVLPQAIARGTLKWGLDKYMHMHAISKLIGLNIVEVAHDIQKQVSSYVTNQLKLINSYDTWHGNALFSSHYSLLLW